MSTHPAPSIRISMPTSASSTGNLASAWRWEFASRSVPTPEAGRNPRLVPFRIAPPYQERVSLRAAPGTDMEVPFGSVLGLEVTGAASDWLEIERAVDTLRRLSTVTPVVLMIDPHAQDLLYVASRAARLPVRAVLFRGEPTAGPLRQQMTQPARLETDVLEWLALRGVRLTPMTAHLIGQIFSHASRYNEVVPLLRDLGNPESSARFRCRKKRLPSPGRWLHVARALRAAFRIQAEPNRSLLALAHELGYSDHSALSNQMQRVFRLRPGEIRKVLGWEWLLDRWLVAEAAKSRTTTKPRCDRKRK